MTYPYEVGEEYKTRDGADVLIVHIDRDMPLPIMGVVASKNGLKYPTSWRIDGSTSWDGLEHYTDLVPPEPVVKTLWVNVYRSDVAKSGYRIYVAAVEGPARPSTLDAEGYIGTFPFNFSDTTHDE